MMICMKTIVAGIALAWCAAAVSAEMPAEEAAKVFQEANVTFGQANKARGVEADRMYEKALLGYKRLIDEGEIRNGKLYANLGNVYLLEDDIGNAVLWYRRAMALEPGNTDIARNLAFARSKRQDKVEPPAEKRVLQTLLFWHYDFSQYARFMVGSLSMALLCLLLTVSIWLGRRPYLTTGAVVTAIVLAAMAASLAVEQVGRRAEGVIVAKETVARQGDGENYPEAFKEPLHAGTEFTVMEKRPGWIRLELADSSRAWVPAGAVELF
jgi:tetratricopeptide (TPR) repeat protein